jgi:HlyD family secretion protein
MNGHLRSLLFCFGIWMGLGALASLTAYAQAAPAQPAVAPAAQPAAAPAAKPEPAPAKPETPPTHTVKKGLLKITVDLDGVFEAQSTAEIAVRLDEWVPTSPLTVVSSAKHGARVKKDEVLVKFDTEKLDKAIEELRAELKLSELGLQQAELQLRALERTTPLDVQANERSTRILTEDQRYYFDVQRPFDLKTAEQQLRSSKNMLEYQQEELRQLEKMYQADDITEETEAIVLKRARDQVEAAKMYVESAQMRHDFALKFGMPRDAERTKDAGQRQQIDLEKSKVTVPLAMQKQGLETDKLRVNQRRADERLKGLLADRERLTIKSPLEGVVYYGKATRGKFGDAQTVGEMLRPLGHVQLNQVFMTVVQPQTLAIRTTIPEEHIQRLMAGSSGTAIPTSRPDLKLPAVISHVGEVPLNPGNFDARLKVTVDKEAKSVMPGMACKVKLVPYLKKDALIVPPKAVQTDELDDHPYVYLLGKDGKAAKRPVTIGSKTDKAVEILQGLAEGDQVLLEAPKEGN